MLANVRQQASKPTIGECEVCNEPVPNTEVWLISGNIWACAQHKAENDALVSRDKSAKAIVEQSRVVDSQVVLKTDILLAQTVPAVELRAAIENNEEIPASEKEHAFAKECLTRYLQFKKAVSEDMAALQEKQNQMRMWQVNAQTAAGKLRTELRDQFKELEINYKPAPLPKAAKTTKAAGPSSPKKTFDKKAVYAAAEKYNVPANGVQMILVSTPSMSPEDAAKHLAGIMGLL